MKKLNFLILLLMLFTTSFLSWGESQLEWNKLGTSGVGVESLDSYSMLALQDNNLPNMSIRYNPLQRLNSEAESIDMYGFSMTNPNNRTNLGIVKFNSGSPADILHIGTSTELIRAGAFANSKYYMISITQNMPKGLYTADTETGELTLIANYLSNGEVRAAVDMSYDYSNETMYLICNGDGNANTALRTVNLETGEQTLINNNMGSYFRAMSVDVDGNMYGINSKGELHKINKATGETTLIGATGRSPFFFQTMEFDRGTGILYWACCEPRHNSELCIVDVNSAVTTSLGLIGGTTLAEQIVALYIPFEMANPGAPNKIESLEAKAEATGLKSVELTWNNPSKSYSGADLTSITKIEILRNNELIKTIENATPGSAMSVTDNVDTSGTYIYKIIPYNAEGTGVAKSVSVFIGHDLPSAVENALAVRESASAIELTWDAATNGINNGYLDLSTIKYKITRVNDNKVVAENLTANSFTDNTITDLARYSYDIEVSNADGVGGVTTTNYVVTGPTLSVPYSSNFANTDESDLWTAVDNNRDGNTFNIGYNYSYKANEFVYTANANQADEWLVSSMIKFEAGKYYKVIADVKCGRADRPETCSLYLIKDRNLNNAVKIGDDFTINVPLTIFKCRADIDNAVAGEYAIAIRCTSAAAMNVMAVSAISIEENHDGAVRGDVWDNTDKPVEGVTVSLDGTEFAATTDSKGQFEIINIPQGSYKISCEKLGYKNTPVDVKVTELTTSNVELDVTLRGKYKLSGFAKNEYGDILPNVDINVWGYNTYAGKTDSKGAFEIADVYEAETDYSVKAAKPFYQDATNSVSVINADVTADLTLKDEILPPVGISADAEDTSSEAKITWSVPGKDYNTDLHGTIINSTFGADQGTENTLIGMMCKNPVALTELNWINYFAGGSVNLIILALDKDGNITSNVLYENGNVKNSMADLTSFVFDTPLVAANGCFIGLSCDKGNLGMGTVAATADYPFVANTYGVIDDYKESIAITYVEEIGTSYKENFFLDYKGFLLATDEAPAVAYNLYRVDGSLNETIVSENINSSLAYNDANWSKLEIGNYKYAVEAVYKNNAKSTKVESNELSKTTSGVSAISDSKFTINVSETHISFSSVVDKATLYSASGINYASVSNADNISISGLPKGVYILAASDAGNNYTQKIIIK